MLVVIAALNEPMSFSITDRRNLYLFLEKNHYQGLVYWNVSEYRQHLEDKMHKEVTNKKANFNIL